jgi:LacI family transcriptional regulator
MEDQIPQEKHARRPNLRQVAERVGVSAMTVSRALRDSPRVATALKARIHKVATELGYVPDPEVARLMSHLRQRNKASLNACIAALTSINEEREPPPLRKVRESARQRAEELGYRLEVFRVSSPQLHNRQLERTLVSRGIEGVLLLQMINPISVDRLLNWDRFAAVVATPSVLTPEFPRVGVNHPHNARLLCAHLAQRGCRRIGFVGTRTFCLRTQDAFPAAAAWHALRQAKDPVPPLLFEEDAGLRQKLRAWLRRHKPDAVIAYAETMLPLLLQELQAGPGPQPQVACTSLHSSPRLAPGIDERHELIGTKAIDTLAGLLARNEHTLRPTHASTLIEGCWVDAANAG